MKGFIYFFALLFLFTSCNPYSDEEKEMYNKEIQEYLEKHNLETKVTDTGLHYIMEKEGEGRFIKSTDQVFVYYTGYLTSGVVFDSTGTSKPREFKLKNTVLGWREGFTFFKKGGKGKLIIPPQLGYGVKERDLIPENAVLIYDFEIVDVK